MGFDHDRLREEQEARAGVYRCRMCAYKISKEQYYKSVMGVCGLCEAKCAMEVKRVLRSVRPMFVYVGENLRD